VLDAVRDLPACWGKPQRSPTVNDIHAGVVHGSMEAAGVSGGVPRRQTGSVDRSAYVFCVLEAVSHHRLVAATSYAAASDRWRDRRPTCSPVRGEGSRTRSDTLACPRNPGCAPRRPRPRAGRGLPAGRRAPAVQHRSERRRAGQVARRDLKAIPEPPSLVDLRKRTAAMMPLVELPERSWRSWAGARVSKRPHPPCPGNIPAQRPSQIARR